MHWDRGSISSPRSTDLTALSFRAPSSRLYGRRSREDPSVSLYLEL